MPAVRSPTNQKAGNDIKAFPSISSLLQKPANGGIPLIATQPIKNVVDVYGIFFLKPPINLIS